MFIPTRLRSIFFVVCFIPMRLLQAQPSGGYLLHDVEVRYLVSNTLSAILNFEFTRADTLILQLKKQYPTHPLGWYLKGYTYYWQLQVNEENKSFDAPFLTYMDSTIEKASKIYDQNKGDYEAVFFLCAAYAFKARLLSDRAEWTASFFAGRNAMVYLNRGKQSPDFAFEFMFGEALYNYYAEWIPENYKAFKPLMWFFEKGDKNKGLELLRKTTLNAYYARTEAQYFLIRILLYEEKNYQEAIPVCKYLIQTYPNNPVFERLYLRLLFNSGSYSACERLSNEVLAKIDSLRPGYEAVSGRFASFFLGWIYMNRDKTKAKIYFERSVAYCEAAGAVKMNYYFYALSALAKFANDEGDKAKAIAYYSKIKSNAERKHELYKEARTYIRKND